MEMRKDSRPMLTLNALRKSFGGLTAVNNLSLSIYPNEILGLIGPNGSGKTTVFNLVTGFYRLDDGNILFKEVEISYLKPYQICQRGLTRTFQLVKPFMNLTAFKNVKGGTYHKANTEKERSVLALDILRFVSLESKKDFLAKDLTLPELKRLELARALATQPDLLLLDEVMAGLTPIETEGFMNLIKKLRQKGLTIFLVEHVMRAVMGLCDRVVVINYGEKIAEGTPVEAVRDRNVIKAYIGEESISAGSIRS
jgi:branched-chain amino acid transport system ATP-binding protein